MVKKTLINIQLNTRKLSQFSKFCGFILGAKTSNTYIIAWELIPFFIPQIKHLFSFLLPIFMNLILCINKQQLKADRTFSNFFISYR